MTATHKFIVEVIHNMETNHWWCNVYDWFDPERGPLSDGMGLTMNEAVYAAFADLDDD